MVWRTSAATFNGSTDNSGNSWSAGTVSLSDDDSTTAMFAASGLAPGSTGSRCIEVTYGGSLAAVVKLYATAASASGDLGDYLDLSIEQGVGGSFSGGCGSFVPSSTIYTGTLASFANAASDFSTGVGNWSPGAAGQTTVYRFTYTLQDDNNAQGLNGELGFTWEAQNT